MFRLAPRALSVKRERRPTPMLSACLSLVATLFNQPEQLRTDAYNETLIREVRPSTDHRPSSILLVRAAALPLSADYGAVAARRTSSMSNLVSPSINTSLQPGA